VLEGDGIEGRLLHQVNTGHMWHVEHSTANGGKINVMNEAIKTGRLIKPRAQ